MTEVCVFRSLSTLVLKNEIFLLYKYRELSKIKVLYLQVQKDRFSILEQNNTNVHFSI